MYKNLISIIVWMIFICKGERKKYFVYIYEMFWIYVKIWLVFGNDGVLLFWICLNNYDFEWLVGCGDWNIYCLKIGSELIWCEYIFFILEKYISFVLYVYRD